MAKQIEAECGDTSEISNENPLMIGIVENSDVVEGFKRFSEMVFRVLFTQTNYTCYTLKHIPMELMGPNNPNISIPDIDIFFFTVDTSVYGRLENFVNSAWVNNPDTFLISKAPEKYETTDSSSLIAWDDDVKLALIIASLLVTLCTTFVSFIIPSKDRRDSFRKLFFKYLWQMSRSISHQAMDNVSRYLSSRIVIGSWLMGSLVIGIYIGSYLSSNLSNIVYAKIDTVSDLITFTKMRPVVIQNFHSHLLMQNKAEYDDVAKGLIKMVDKEKSFVTIEGLISDDQLLQDIRYGKKALLIHRVLWIAIFDIIQDEVFDFYYGEESLSSGVMAGFYNRRLSVSNQETMNLIILRMVETELHHQILSRNKYLLGRRTWQPDPEAEVSPTTLKDLSSVFRTTLVCQCLICLILLAEILYPYFSRDN